MLVCLEGKKQIIFSLFDLPTELTFKIFDYLPDLASYLQMGVVCKTFNAYIKDDKTLQKRLNAIFGNVFPWDKHIFNNLIDHFNPSFLSAGVFSVIHVPLQTEWESNSSHYQYKINANWLLTLSHMENSTEKALCFIHRNVEKTIQRKMSHSIQSIHLWQDRYFILTSNLLNLYEIERGIELFTLPLDEHCRTLYSEQWLFIQSIKDKTIRGYHYHNLTNQFMIDLSDFPEIGYLQIHEQELLLLSNDSQPTVFILSLSMETWGKKVFQYRLEQSFDWLSHCQFNKSFIFLKLDSGSFFIDRNEASEHAMENAKVPSFFSYQKEDFSENLFRIDHATYPSLEPGETILSVKHSIVTTWDGQGFNFRIPYYPKVLRRPLKNSFKFPAHMLLDQYKHDALVFVDKTKIYILQQTPLQNISSAARVSQEQTIHVGDLAAISDLRIKRENGSFWKKLYCTHIIAYYSKKLMNHRKKIKRTLKKLVKKSDNEVDKMIYAHAYHFFKKIPH